MDLPSRLEVSDTSLLLFVVGATTLVLRAATPQLNIPGFLSPATVFALELPSSQRRDGIRPRTPSVAASYSAILRRCSPSNSLRRSSAIPATVFSLELPPSQRRDSIRPRTPSVTPSVTPVVPLNSSTGNSSSGGDRLFHTASSLLLLLRRTSYKKRMRELCFVFGIM